MATGEATAVPSSGARLWEVLGRGPWVLRSGSRDTRRGEDALSLMG